MPSGAYGRGGGNFMKKPKTPATPDASAKSNRLKSSENVSLLKKIVHAMPGSQSKTSRASASQPPRDITNRHMNPQQTHGNNPPARLNTNPSRRPAHQGTPMGASRRNVTPAVNLNTITPSSSEDESRDSGHSERPLSPNGILPFTSRPMSTDESTAVNETPFSAPAVPRTFKAHTPAPGDRSRTTSMNGGSRRRTMPPPPKQDLNQHVDQKALAFLEGKLGVLAGEGNVIRRPPSNDNRFKGGRRISLATPTVSRTNPPRRPISEFGTFSEPLPSKLHESALQWSENIVATPAPHSDPFNHLFTSCVISLILLIILAAGRDILYVVALLPVLMTLAKHFLDLNQLGFYTPLMRRNLESLLSI